MWILTSELFDANLPRQLCSAKPRDLPFSEGYAMRNGRSNIGFDSYKDIKSLISNLENDIYAFLVNNIYA